MNALRPPQPQVIVHLRSIHPVKDKPKRLSWCAVWWTREIVTHVELSLKIRCTRKPDTCRYCKLSQRSDASKRAFRQISLHHDVTFLITKYSHVEVQLQKDFAQLPQYREIVIKVSNEQYTLLKDFLELQLGQPFNRLGYWCNFLCPAALCCYGCGYHRSSNPLTPRRWFCSELCTAALVHAKILELPDGIHPCQVTPGQLAVYLGDNGFTPKKVIDVSALPLKGAFESTMIV